MNRLIIIFVICLGSICASSQSVENYPASNDVAAAIDIQQSQPYFIKVATSKKKDEYFPKLYPIGYIVKDTNKDKKTTNYLLGDFASEGDAKLALEEVKSHGYMDAYVVRIEAQ